MPIRVLPKFGVNAPQLSARIGANVKSLDVSGPIGGGINVNNRGVIIRKPSNPLITIQNQLNQQVQQRIPVDIHFEQLQRDGFTPRTRAPGNNPGLNTSPVGGAILGAAVGTAIGGIVKQKEGLLPGALLGAGLGSIATQLQDRDLDKLNRDGFTNRLSTTGGVLTGGALGAGIGSLFGGDDKKNMIIGGVAGAAFGGIVASIAEQNALNQQVDTDGFLKNGVSDFLGKNGVLGTGIEPGRDPRENELNSKGFVGKSDRPAREIKSPSWPESFEKKTSTLGYEVGLGTKARDLIKKDYARPVDYEVVIHSPLNGLDREVSFNAAAAVIPSENIATFEHSHYGPIRKYPYRQQYQDMSITFYCSSDMREFNFFREWANKVISRDNYHMNYTKDYEGTLNIYQFNRQGDVTLHQEVLHVYPITIGELSLDYSSNDTIHKLPITFAWFTVIDKLSNSEKSGLQQAIDSPGASMNFAAP